MTFGHIAAFLAGCIAGGVATYAFCGLASFHRAVRKGFNDVRPSDFAR